MKTLTTSLTYRHTDRQNKFVSILRVHIIGKSIYPMDRCIHLPIFI